jgi:phosphopantothenoylcysteine decarboxylase/phosphopantothenate--cysteine ligase
VSNCDLTGYEVIVGVCGGIAAYKTCAVVSRLVQAGAGVRVIMTKAARKFVGAQTLAALSGRRVHTSLWESQSHYSPQHIRLGEDQDLLLIAPATANIIAKIATGIADDLLSTTVVGADCPVMLAPAMNARMWNNPVVQRNVQTLRETDMTIIEPGTGWQACRSVGRGRMAEPEQILSVVEARLRSAPPRQNT